MILASIVCSLGFPVLVTRYGATYFIREQWGYLKGLLKYSNKRITIVSISFIVLTLIIFSIDFFDLKPYSSIKIGLPIILFLSLSSIRTSALTAIEKVNYSQLPEMIIRPIIFLLFILIFYFFYDLNNISAIAIYTLTNGIVFFCGVILLRKFLPKKVKIAKENYEPKIWNKTAIPLFILGSVQVISQHSDIFILGLLTSDDNVGVYKSMYQISILIIFSLSAINAISAPYIVREIEYNNQSGLKQLLFKFCFINSVISIIIALPFIICGDFFVNLLYGNDYESGITCLKILILGRIINSIFGSSNHFLKMLGEEKKATKGIVLGVILGIILNIILVPNYGINGAAIASSSALVFWNFHLFFSTVKSINKLNLKNEITNIN